MFNYLRLLFVGSVLLIVLGLYNGQNSRAEINNIAANGIEQTSKDPAHLPFDPLPGRYIQSPCNTPPQGSPAFLRQIQQTDLSRQSNRRIQMARKIVDDIRPELLFRTGRFIYSQSPLDLPS
jgi:hypothetical protein